MRKLSLVVGSIVFLTACGFNPAEGDWNAEFGTVVTDTCGLFAEATPDGGDPEALVLTDDGFMLGDADCTLDGKDFDCSPEVEVQMFDAPLEGTITTSAMVGGVFDDAESATGTASFSTDCDGADCAAVAALVGWTFPCEATIDYTASYVGE